jgi:hypothetical protein
MGLAVLEVERPSAEAPAWAMMTPLVFASESSTGAVIVNGTFFTLMNAFSVIPVIPG